MRLRGKQRLDYYLGGLLIGLLRPVVPCLGWLLQRDHAPTVRGDICVIKVLGGGSLVIAYPALLGLRERYPDRELSLICGRAVVPFAETLGIFDRLLVVDDSDPVRLATGTAAAIRGAWRVDTVLDLEVYSRLSTVLSLLTAARNRVGFYLNEIFWRQGLHTHLAFFNRASPSYLFYEKATELLGARPATSATCRERLEEQIPARREEGPRPLCVGSGCSELSLERRLTPGQWRRVFEERSDQVPDRVVLLGGPEDRPFAERIVRELRAALPKRDFENRCGELSLLESLAILRGGAAYWGIDSALLHYARLLGLRCLSFWGPTDPATLLRPMAQIEEEVVYRKIPCSPCVHLSESPPCKGNNLCIQNLFDEPDAERWPAYVDW